LKSLDRIDRADQKKKAAIAKADGKRLTTDKNTKELKKRLAALHLEVRNSESRYSHIHWLQERFPSAAYENVTGLCNLAESSEVIEQDYSLNPGRYVGVVIEEDGRTEEEFIDELVELDEQLGELGESAAAIEQVISSNIRELVG
jgi:type I restriction enzyme M protein